MEEKRGLAMSLGNIRIVLVGPLYGGNIGAVCRAMATVSYTHLTLPTIYSV